MKKTRKINIVKILLVISILFIIDLLIVINSVRAESLNSANIYSIGDCGNLLTYKGVIVKVSYVQYTKDNVNYPAYCLDKTKPGAETSPYDVSINSAIKDVGLWRRIINGYPYNETQISNTITINRIDSEWKQDSIDKSYAYKVYSVQAGSSIMNYTVDVTKEGSESIGGIKITDENNQEKSEFSPNENFKILIPINNMKDTGTLYIKVKSKVETKPVLYGTAPSSSYQDYALTVATYEDGIGNIKDEYNKNETKIIIIKKDQDDGKVLEGIEFQLLNDKKEVIYADLKTDSDGKIVIENLVPGNYYIKEIKTIDGYELYEYPIQVEVGFNQEVSVTVNNKKEEKPQIITNKTASKEIKRLPVTGM